jgi:hypothetical protein
VKTRLAAALGASAAARLHEAFLRDVLGRVLLRPDTDVVLYHDPEDPGPTLARLGVALRPQQGTDLGERLGNAFAAEAAGGAEHVVVLGADSPDLPPGRIDQAFAELRRAALVIGPSFDGGYYLIGVRGHPAPAVFDGVPWGSAGVLAATLGAVRERGIAAHLLDAWYDVDRPADLDFLAVHLSFLLEAGGEDRCPVTRTLLEKLGVPP